MNALDQIAVDEGMGMVRLLLHVAALILKVAGLEREVEELKTRLQIMEGSERP